MIENDEGLYGVDEILAFSIVNVYGSIGFTNYGYVDKLKPGVLERLNDKSLGPIHTFLDDIVGAIAASASSRIAHRKQAEREQELGKKVHRIQPVKQQTTLGIQQIYIGLEEN